MITLVRPKTKSNMFVMVITVILGIAIICYKNTKLHGNLYIVNDLNIFKRFVKNYLKIFLKYFFFLKQLFYFSLWCDGNDSNIYIKLFK